MKELPRNIVNFFKEQSFIIVSTLDSKGRIHCSAKGLAVIEEEGKVYIIDLYRTGTFNNLKKNPVISITAVDEHRFMGYTLKGKAKIVERENIKGHIIKNWQERLIQRMSKRVIKDIKKESKTPHHPESRFPYPEYLIEMKVEEVVDLTPSHLRMTSSS